MNFQLIHNATIISMDDAFAKADSMVINDAGKIEAIGSAIELRKQFDSFKETIDFQGKTIVPGLNDAHIHVWKIGHLRWRIENNAFNELTQHWNLEHCAHHHPQAIIALLLIKVLAFNLFKAFAQLHGKQWRAGKITFQELRLQLYRALELDPVILFFSG